MRYTTDQIKTALLLLKTTGSPNKVIELLGYPSNPMLYHWRDKYPEYYDNPLQKHWKQASSELKRNTIERCAIRGESVKSVAEDIGYSPSLINKWLRDYQKKGFTPSMKKSKADTPHIHSDISSVEDFDAIKAQIVMFMLYTLMCIDNSGYYTMLELTSSSLFFPFEYMPDKTDMMEDDRFIFSNFGGDTTVGVKE